MQIMWLRGFDFLAVYITPLGFFVILGIKKFYKKDTCIFSMLRVHVCSSCLQRRFCQPPSVFFGLTVIPKTHQTTREKQTRAMTKGRKRFDLTREATKDVFLRLVGDLEWVELGRSFCTSDPVWHDS